MLRWCVPLVVNICHYRNRALLLLLLQLLPYHLLYVIIKCDFFHTNLWYFSCFCPQLEKMLEPQVWREAATQVFFALGLGFGGVIAFSSYNKRDNNCHFDAALVSIINFVTSILATLVVFAVLGFKANVMNEKCVVEWVCRPVTNATCPISPCFHQILTDIFHISIISVQKRREDRRLPIHRCAEQGAHPSSHQLLPPVCWWLRRDVRRH